MASRAHHRLGDHLRRAMRGNGSAVACERANGQGLSRASLMACVAGLLVVSSCQIRQPTQGELDRALGRSTELAVVTSPPPTVEPVDPHFAAAVCALSVDVSTLPLVPD